MAEDFKEEGVMMHPSSFPDIIGKQGVTIKAECVDRLSNDLPFPKEFLQVSQP